MICPNCKKQLDDALSVCPDCNTMLFSASGEVIENKNDYIKKMYGKNHPIYKYFRFFPYLCVVSLIFALVIALFTSVYDLPTSEIIFSNEDMAELDKAHTRAAYTIKSTDDVYTEFAAVLDASDERQVEKIFSNAQSFADMPSLFNVIRFLSHYNDPALTQTFSKLIKIIIISCIVLSIATLYFAYRKNTVLLSVTFAACEIYALIFSNATAASFVMIAFGILIFLTARLNHNYAKYIKNKN